MVFRQTGTRGPGAKRPDQCPGGKPGDEATGPSLNWKMLCSTQTVWWEMRSKCELKLSVTTDWCEPLLVGRGSKAEELLSPSAALKRKPNPLGRCSTPRLRERRKENTDTETAEGTVQLSWRCRLRARARSSVDLATPFATPAAVLTVTGFAASARSDRTKQKGSSHSSVCVQPRSWEQH